MNASHDAAGIDRRRHARVELNLLIQYRFENFDDFLMDRSVDLSVGGLFIRTETPREEGAIVFLQFRLRDGSQLIEGMGRVVRVNPPGDPNRTPGMGIEFVNLDERSRQLIEGVVAHRMAHLDSKV